MARTIIAGVKSAGAFEPVVRATAAQALLAAADASLLAKEAVDYREWPMSRESCSRCAFYRPEGGRGGACSMVAGMVAATGWCAIWAAAVAQ